MTSFAIQTDDEEDLGFILFARHDGDWPPAGKNECIFNGFPYDAALLDDPRGRFLMEQKGQEWIADVSYSATEMLVRIDLSTGWVFELRSTESGKHLDSSACWDHHPGHRTISLGADKNHDIHRQNPSPA